MVRLRFGAAVTAGAVAVLALSGCFLPMSPVSPTGTGDPVVEAPAGWAEFPHCEDAPDDAWVWIDGFPAEAFEAAGVEVECGDTWIEDDGENFLNVTSYSVTEADLDALGAQLEALGYELLVDEFVPVAENAVRDYAGARDYYLRGAFEGDFTRMAIEIYANGGAGTPTYVAYFDYLSPLTREL
jgi:hypothetical protein